MASFLTAAAAAIGSSSIGSALVRILVAYGVSRLINKSTGQDNGSGAIDQGVRLQAAPDTTNPIPLLYGSAYLGGKITDAQLTDANQIMWYCLTLSEVPTAVTTRLSDGAAITTSVDEIYWNNQRVYFKADGVTVDYLVNQDGIVDTSPRDLVKIYLYGNGSFNPMLPSDLGEYISPLPSVPGDARAVFPAWDNTFRMAGLTFALVKVSYNRDKGITGLPELQFKVSNNLFKPGDAIYSFLTNPISGADLSATEIDTASLVALNDYADDEVNYIDETDGLTYQLGDRYQINGIVNPSNNVLDNLTALANNCGAFVNYDIARGLWGVKINRDAVTALAFDDSNIISGIDLTGTALDNMYNSVIVEFPHRQLRDQIDTIRIDLPDEFRNANEPDNTLNIRLDLLNEPLQARELAYLELYQNRMDRVITFTTDYSKINAEAGDVITVTNSIYGFVNQPFKIVRVREIEAEAGGIAVEITAQEYDATMYTAGGQPRRPRVPSVPITIPEITVIGTPAAPTVVQLNNVAVPALDITGLTPSGIVDRFEFWYSSDAGVTYKVLGSRSNSNGSPYNQNTSLTFRAASLPAGTYLFKVRGGNENAFGDFSPASTSVVWAPVQVTDQVTENTTVGGSMADLIGPLAMGAVAYFAYQALYPEIMKALGDSELGSIFGIPSSAVQEMKNAAGNFKLIQVGDSIQTPYNNDTITFIAGDGIEITAQADAGEITISATGGGTGAVSKIIAGEGITVTPAAGTGEVTISLSGSTGGGGTGPVDSGGATSGSSYVLNGSVFPCTYDVNNQDKPAIFAHGNMVFANSSYNDTIKRENIVTPDTVLTPILTVPTSDIVPSEPPATQYDTDQFTGGPSTASTDTAAEAAARADAVSKANALYGNTWSETSFNEVKVKLNDNGTYTATYILRVQYPLTTTPPTTDTRTDNYRYYSKCTYNSALGLADQAWSDWKKWKEPVTETKQVLIGYTNPPVSSSIGYIVDGEYTDGGVGLKSPSDQSLNYDVFKPSIPNYTTTTVTVDYQTVKCGPGEMVVFGACNRDLGDTVAFTTNTIFGIETQDTIDRTATKNTFAGTQAVTNGSIYVSPDPTVYDQMYWSSDSITWNKVVDVTFTGPASTSQNSGYFKLMPYNTQIGKFIAYRNYNNSALQDYTAYSTDGKAWTESATGLPITYSAGSVSALNSFKSNNTSGEYIAYPSSGGIKGSAYYAYYSNNGLTWTALPSAIKALNSDAGVMEPIPGSATWMVSSYSADTLKYFNLGSGSVGNFTFAPGVKGIYEHVTGLLNAKTQPSDWGDALKAQNNQRYNSVGYIRIIPRSATSFYVVCTGSAVYWYRTGDTFNQGYRDAIETIYATYTVSGTTITASSFTTTDPVAPNAQPGAITTLATGVTRYTKYPVAVAYATEYHYPGVSGTPVIYRAGDYGVGAYSNSVSMKATYSTA